MACEICARTALLPCPCEHPPLSLRAAAAMGESEPLLDYVQLLRTKLEALREIALGAQVIAKSSGVGRITRSGRAQIEKALRDKLGAGVSVVVVTPPTHGGETVLDPSGARDKLRSDSGS